MVVAFTLILIFNKKSIAVDLVDMETDAAINYTVVV